MTAACRELCGGRARGFTLVELICCLVIIGILAATVGPIIFDNSPFQASGYAQEVADAVHETQAIAVASNCAAEITINAAGYSALQRAVAGNTCAVAGGWVTAIKRGDGTALSGAPPNGITALPGMQIVFNASGQVTNGTPAALQIGTHTVSIDPVSGLVSVQ
jgi:prepilin-type N-terminal cleavage/methylation domain-containing protein